MQKPPQKIGKFACQSAFLTVGQPGGFATYDDYLRYVADCGFEIISVPLHPMMFDLDAAAARPDYVDELHNHIQRLGIQHGLGRIEIHTDGQNGDLSEHRILRFGFFVSDKFASMSRFEIEQMAHARIRKTIDVVAPHPRLRRLVGFLGGKGYAVGQAKWSAWPKHFPLWVIASHARAWIPTLEYAGDRGVTLHPELGHPENDLLTGQNFVLFHRFLTLAARKGLGLQADGSHFVNIGVDPLPHFDAAASTGCLVENHYKWGAIADPRDGTCSAYGGWQNWSEASHSFYTIGTVGSENLVRKFQDFMMTCHERQEGGCDIYCEAECVGIMNPKQAMKIGAHNCRALRDQTPLIRLDGFVRDNQPMITEATPPSDRQLVLPNGSFESLEPWSGGPFDAFADSPVKPGTLLGLTPEEISATAAILLAAGFEDAARVHEVK